MLIHFCKYVHFHLKCLCKLYKSALESVAFVIVYVSRATAIMY